MIDKLFLLWVVATTLAFFVKGLCGFGNTLVFGSTLSFGVDNINITPVDLLMGIPSNIILAWRDRKNIIPKLVIPLSVLVIAGVIPGAYFLKNSDTSKVKLVFGGVVIISAFILLYQEYKRKKTADSEEVRISLPIMLTFGLVSGLLVGMYGIGVLLAAYISSICPKVSVYKSNVCFVFVVDNIARLIIYSVMGIITFSSIKLALCLLPFMFLGLGTGIWVGKKFNDRTIKMIVIVMLIISGVSLIATNI